MTLEIRGIPIEAMLRARITREVTASLARLTVEPVSAQVTVSDDNGPKGGPAIRCAITVRLPHQPHVRVEDVGETTRLAFDRTFVTLERQLARYRERARDLKRYPKKYFAARRLLTRGAPAAEGGPEATRKRRRAGSR